MFADDVVPAAGWRVFYKQPLPKRSGDLQWRLVHGAIASAVHLAHFEPGSSSACPFCSQEESFAHIFIFCYRLSSLFALLGVLCGRMGQIFTHPSFVFGPGYSFANRHKCCLVNFLFGEAKLAVWVTRRNRIRGSGPTDPLSVFRGFVEARLSIEYAHAELKNDVTGFEAVWCVEGAICTHSADGLTVHLA